MLRPFTFLNDGSQVLLGPHLTFKRRCAVGAAEDHLFSVDVLPVTPLVDLACTVGADVEAWLNRDGDEVGEALEEPVAEVPPLLC